MMGILLDENEVAKTLSKHLRERPHHEWDSICVFGAIEKAQLKKVFEWGEEVCSHDNGCSSPRKKWACPICRLELKREVDGQ